MAITAISAFASIIIHSVLLFISSAYLNQSINYIVIQVQLDDEVAKQRPKIYFQNRLIFI